MGILQARILEWVAISFYRESFQPRDKIFLSCGSCIAAGFFTIWATREALKQMEENIKKKKNFVR